MTQPSDSDYSMASGQSGTAVRTALNDYLQGLLTKNAGATAPADTFPGMDWIDTSGSPAVWKIRNQADDAWLSFANIDASTGIEILNEGAAVPGTGTANTFTENQTIDKASAAGSLTIKSDRTTGIAASLDFGGHDDGGNDTIYASIDAEITDDTDGSEDGQIVLRALAAGSEVARLTVGATVAVNGTLNATTLQQGGTAIATLIENAIKNAGINGSTSTTRTIPTNLTAGDFIRFTGSSAATYTVAAGTAGDVYGIINDGTADISFTTSGTTIIGGTTLGQQKVCTLVYVTTTRAFIFGQNA